MIDEMDAKKGVENYFKFWSNLLHKSELQLVFDFFPRWFLWYVNYNRRFFPDDLLNRLLSFILTQLNFGRAELFFVFT